MIRVASVYVLFIGFTAHAGEVRTLLRSVEETYRNLDALEASFNQVYRSTRFGEKKASGKVLASKPCNMRWEYDSPKGKLLVATEKSVTLYDPEDRQALIGTYEKKAEKPLALSLLCGEARIEETFECVASPSVSPAPAGKSLKCLPKGTVPNIKAIELTIDPKESLLLSYSSTDLLDGETSISFSRIKKNGSLPKNAFTFVPPEGTNLVPIRGGEIPVK